MSQTAKKNYVIIPTIFKKNRNPGPILYNILLFTKYPFQTNLKQKHKYLFAIYFTHFLLVRQFMPIQNSLPKCAKRIGNESKHNIFLGCGSIEYFVCRQTETEKLQIYIIVLFTNLLPQTISSSWMRK